MQSFGRGLKWQGSIAEAASSPTNTVVSISARAVWRLHLSRPFPTSSDHNYPSDSSVHLLELFCANDRPERSEE